MDTIEEVFRHYKMDSRKKYEIVRHSKSRSYDAFCDPYREEYYDEYVILFIEDFDIRCIEITIVMSTKNVYINNIQLTEAREIFRDEDVVYMIDLYLYSKDECKEKDHIVLDNVKRLNY